MPPGKGRFPRGLNTNISEEAHVALRAIVRHFEDHDYDSSRCAVVDAIIRLAKADPRMVEKIAGLLPKKKSAE
jgi:hypothetical protein